MENSSEKVAEYMREYVRYTSRVVAPSGYMIEFCIKRAIVACAQGSGENPNLEAYSISQLWNELLRQIRAAGLHYDDEQAVHCTKLIQKLHEMDPGGNRFRFRTTETGFPFGCTKAEYNKLTNTLYHVGMFCKQAMHVLKSSGPQNPG